MAKHRRDGLTAKIETMVQPTGIKMPMRPNETRRSTDHPCLVLPRRDLSDRGLALRSRWPPALRSGCPGAPVWCCAWSVSIGGAALLCTVGSRLCVLGWLDAVCTESCGRWCSAGMPGGGIGGPWPGAHAGAGPVCAYWACCAPGGGGGGGCACAACWCSCAGAGPRGPDDGGAECAAPGAPGAAADGAARGGGASQKPPSSCELWWSGCIFCTSSRHAAARRGDRACSRAQAPQLSGPARYRP